MTGTEASLIVTVVDALEGSRVTSLTIPDSPVFTVASLQSHVLSSLLPVSAISSASCAALATQLTFVFRGAVLLPSVAISALKDSSREGSSVTVSVLIPPSIESLMIKRDNPSIFADNHHHFLGPAPTRFMFPTSPVIPAVGGAAVPPAAPAAPVAPAGVAGLQAAPVAGAAGIAGGQANLAGPAGAAVPGVAAAAPGIGAGPFNLANMIRVFMFAMIFGSSDTMIPLFCLMVFALGLHYVYRHLFPAFNGNGQQAGGAAAGPEAAGTPVNLNRNVVRKRYPGVLGFVSDVEWFLYGLFSSVNPGWDHPEVPAENEARRPAAVEVQ